MKIGVAGLWHLGSVLCAYLVKNNMDVVAYDENMDRIEKLKTGKAPIFEPGLDDLLTKGLKRKNLEFTSEVSELFHCDYIWCAYDTLTDEDNICLLDNIYEFVKNFNKDNVCHNFIISSQVPVGTSQRLTELIDSCHNPQIAYIPENLQLGKALEVFGKTGFLALGCDNRQYRESLLAILKKISIDVVCCSLITAEIAKHTINGLLGTIISFSNAIAHMAIAVGADAYDIVTILKKDPRFIGKLPLFPGPWFSGGTLARDLKVLELNSEEDGAFFKEILEINNRQSEYFIKLIRQYAELKTSSVAVVGAIYTENTDTLKHSPGIKIAKELICYGATVKLFEPFIGETEMNGLEFTLNLESIVQEADVIILLRIGAANYLKDKAYLLRRKVVLDIWDTLSLEDIKLNEIKHITPGKGMCKNV